MRTCLVVPRGCACGQGPVRRRVFGVLLNKNFADYSCREGIQIEGRQLHSYARVDVCARSIHKHENMSTRKLILLEHRIRCVQSSYLVRNS